MTSDREPLPYGRQWVDEDDERAVLEQLRSDWLTTGPTIDAFENALAERLGVRHVVAVSSGTAALHLACLAADLGPGTCGVTSPITFLASANALRYVGAEPLLADVDATTALMDVDALAALCEQRTIDAVIPVDFAGQAADLARIRALAPVVIEDAAHSLGGTYEVDGATYACGSCAHSDMAILSFHPVKQITTAEGGAITSNDDGLAGRLRQLRNHGIGQQGLTRDDGPWYHEQQVLGFNYRLSALHAALGLSQLGKLDRFVTRRRELASAYDERLAPLGSRIRPLAALPGRGNAYHLYVVGLVARAGESNAALNLRRRSLYLALREEGILTQVHYIPLHYQPDFQKAWSYDEGSFPAAERYYASCLSLPLFPRMTDGDVERVITSLVRGLDRVG
ncbi:MAG: UDP-4-amino-4,6-dideoxy-N-acetyl-beta-L-altrosamine transaminase [Chloroflexi bacterium]|nr:UDP-4-amino-4,6-dideoxy-N-acetyl-beta-L-altrosamine transaminase [Chloroflexota bacterium]